MGLVLCQSEGVREEALMSRRFFVSSRFCKRQGNRGIQDQHWSWTLYFISNKKSPSPPSRLAEAAGRVKGRWVGEVCFSRSLRPPIPTHCASTHISVSPC
eukprot:Hpha_TRINITY_DN13919_c0_g3::TRINITY_DN13919_c0_g3_i1::g.35846::m.35846